VERCALTWTGTGPVGVRALTIPAGNVAGGGTAYPSLSTSTTTSGGPVLQDVSENGDGYMELKKRWASAFEREYLLNALNRNNGNVSAAAREAKIDRSNFLRLLRRYGIKANEYRKAA
jgi:anaerobic nitric oxide reductase transcription regulator